ncbi:MAG TPA: hypothetical protein PLC98_16150 [Anaerolineales bacterium]|nr:hypothetical protein [Anaerolineales bacterium]
MHPYKIDDDIRNRVILGAAAISVFVAWLSSLLLSLLPLHIPWWLETPSILGVYGIIVWLFDQYLWKTQLVQRFGFIRIPDLNGVWRGEIRSSHGNFEPPHVVSIVIRQTATTISICAESASSESQSVTATFHKKEGLSKYELVYNYVNRPKAHSVDTMSIHYGTAWLKVSDDMGVLDGDYFTGRGRQTFGSITASRNTKALPHS